MDLDTTALTYWLLQNGNLWIIVYCACGFIGLLFLTPDTYGKKRAILSTTTRIINSGIIGGLAFGMLIPFVAIPLGLLLKISASGRVDVSRGTWYLLQMLYSSIYFYPIWKVFPRLFAQCFITGFPLGLLVGLLLQTGAIVQNNGMRRYQLPVIPTNISRRNFVVWCMFGCVIGYAFGTMFGWLAGLLVGFSLGLVAFFLGLSPKPVETPDLSLKKSLIYFFFRVLSFWFIIGGSLILLLVHTAIATFTIKIVPGDTILSVSVSIFLAIIILLCFWYFIKQGNKLAQQQPFEKKSISERDETGFYPGEKRIVLNSLKCRKAFNTGIVYGMLIYSVALGGSMAFITGKFYGFTVGVVFEVVFIILGLGFGIACGFVLVYAHVLGPVFTNRIEEASERRLIIVGVGLTSLGIFLPMLQHFLN